MQEDQRFYPEQRTGLLFQGIVLGLLIALGGWGTWQLLRSTADANRTLSLLLVLLNSALALLLTYRLYALLNAGYTLERDGLHIQWGLTRIDLPMADILGVHQPEVLGVRLRAPFPSWPGSLLGARRTAGLGNVEFLAANKRDLLLVATQDQLYAISPANPQAFLEAYQHYAEMGSLVPSQVHRQPATRIFAQIRNSRAAQLLLSLVAALSALLFLWAWLEANHRETITLGSQPGDLPAAWLLLLPLLNLAFQVINLTVGILAFRHPQRQIYSLLLWGAGILTAILFGAAMFTALN